MSDISVEMTKVLHTNEEFILHKFKAKGDKQESLYNVLRNSPGVANTPIHQELGSVAV